MDTAKSNDIKLVVFGDSYANKERAYDSTDEYIPWSWSNSIENNFSSVENFAHAGSSETFSRCKVFDYLDSEEYSEDDIFVFFTTSIWRMPFLSHFKKPSMQAIYMSIAMEYEAGYSNLQNFNDDVNKIKNNPNWYINLHDICTEDSINIYKQTLMFALFLKNLPNKVIYYDTFYTQHRDILAGYAGGKGDTKEHRLNFDKNFNYFIKNRLQDSDTFIFQKSRYAREIGKLEGYKNTIDWKIHNHFNIQQNKEFCSQMTETINTFTNCFDEDKLIDMIIPIRKIKESR